MHNVAGVLHYRRNKTTHSAIALLSELFVMSNSFSRINIYLDFRTIDKCVLCYCVIIKKTIHYYIKLKVIGYFNFIYVFYIQGPHH